MPITAHHIRVVNGQGTAILDDVHVSIPDASVTLVVGRNGAGKSTLLDALSGLAPLQAGEVHYDAKPLWKGKRLNVEVLRLFGNVFQNPEQQLFAQTVEKEFAFSLKYMRLSPAEIDERSRLALRQADLSEAWLSASPLQLSGGMKRRVALASTMATDPSWLFLDEPTAGLDADGISALLDWLKQQRKEGKGIVIATHDLDTLLPLADHVIVLRNGQVVAQIAGEDIVRSAVIFHEAGLGVPIALYMADMLASRGGKLTNGYPDAEHMAEMIEQHLQSEKLDRGQELASARSEDDRLEELRSEEYETKHPLSSPEAPSPTGGASGLAAVDPRAKWLFSLLMSIGILLQTNWLGLLVSGVITAVVLGSVQGAWRTMLRLSIPFAIFILISMTVSGLELGEEIRFSVESAQRTSFELLKILVTLGIGVGFAASTSQLMMKHALEQSLSGLRKLRFPVDAAALGASLILRFIPVLMKEFRRFARIVRARGKRPARIGVVRLRELPAMFIPLLISLFQLASDLTTAMHARGLTSFQQERTMSFELKMRRGDWFVMTIGALGFVLLWALALL